MGRNLENSTCYPVVMLLGGQIHRACSLVASDSPAASPGNQGAYIREGKRQSRDTP